jgi:flavorubredoxin
MTRIAEGVFWVGAIDWTLRDFHGRLGQKLAQKIKA